MSYLELSDVEIQQIREDPENQDWKFISYNYVLSEEFIKEFFDRFNDSFGTLLTYQKITESFLYSIKDQIIGIKWSYLSMNNLSENFIRDFEDKLYWFFISKYQKLSKQFIVEFSDKINSYGLSLNDNFSDELKEFCRMFV